MVHDRQWKGAEGRREAARKELRALAEAITVLQERASLQDQKLKEADERKEWVHELQRVRERLALREGRQGGVPPVKTPVSADA
jgi:hypothetical protein